MKQIETRSWRTLYTGPLAIHAAKVMPGYAKEFLRDRVNPYLGARQNVQFPLGAVVATCTLVRCIPTHVFTRTTKQLPIEYEHHVPMEQEFEFGNFDHGRWAWLLKDVKPLYPPIPVVGHQHVWSWPEGDSL